ncbi:MAG: tetratricopeptide repeat protein, partial [Gemmatimonadota bacterium]
REVVRRPTIESWDALAWVHHRRGELTEALAASDRALAWGSPSPTIEYHRARILEALGRPREAAPWLERATADPGLLDPSARIDLGSR